MNIGQAQQRHKGIPRVMISTLLLLVACPAVTFASLEVGDFLLRWQSRFNAEWAPKWVGLHLLKEQWGSDLIDVLTVVLWMGGCDGAVYLLTGSNSWQMLLVGYFAGGAAALFMADWTKRGNVKDTAETLVLMAVLVLVFELLRGGYSTVNTSPASKEFSAPQLLAANVYDVPSAETRNRTWHQ